MRGLMEVQSLRKKQYFCPLVNDKMGYMWYQPCALKSDFIQWFMKMDSLFANHYKTHTKILRSNWGGEYINVTLEEYCDMHGIIQYLTHLNKME